MEFSLLISSVSGFIMGVVGGITAVAGIKVLPGVARWGYDQVISWFGDSSGDSGFEINHDAASGLNTCALCNVSIPDSWECCSACYPRAKEDGLV